MGIQRYFTWAHFACLACALAMSTPAAAQKRQPGPVHAPSTHDQQVATINANTVTVISGNPNGTYLKIAYDLSAVLDDGDNLRVLPIVGKGDVENIRDILFLKGVDMGMATSATISILKEREEYGRDLDKKLCYITVLYNTEVHVLARPEIKTLRDLEGKAVNFSDVGSVSQFATRYLFNALGIHAKEVNMGQDEAVEKMKKGELAATILMAGKPSGVYQTIKRNEHQFHFVPIPYDDGVPQVFLPTQLTAKDYPTLIPAGTEVETVAQTVLLVAYNWPENSDRYRRLARFVDAFYSKLKEFDHAPRHPKWSELNFAATVPGLIRFKRAQEIIDAESMNKPVGVTKAADAQDSDLKDPAAYKNAFQKFLETMAQSGRSLPKSPAEQDALFQEFLAWSKAKNR